MESLDAQVREFESDNNVFYQLKQAWSGHGGKCLSLGSSTIYTSVCNSIYYIGT